MEIKLKRFLDNGKATFGIMSWNNNEFESFTLEDTYRLEKVHGKTRIPAGFYQLKLKEVLTNKTKEYRVKYSWFSYHLELQNVQGFEAVYIHIGNYAKDTEGCILLGAGCEPSKDMITGSTDCFKSFYRKALAVLNSGEELWIRIEDEQA